MLRPCTLKCICTHVRRTFSESTPFLSISTSSYAFLRKPRIYKSKPLPNKVCVVWVSGHQPMRACNCDPITPLALLRISKQSSSSSVMTLTCSFGRNSFLPVFDALKWDFKASHTTLHTLGGAGEGGT